MNEKKIDLQIRETSDYSKIENELMAVLEKYDLNYIEAFGVLETLKLQIAESFTGE